MIDDEAALLELENRVCSHGDTVHYADHPKLFARSEGSYLYDRHDTAYLDLQMWYSAVNLGYGNQRINDALKAQLDTLPQLASQYLHKEKVDLAEIICKYMEEKYGVKGRVHFNVGGAHHFERIFHCLRATYVKVYAAFYAVFFFHVFADNFC